MKHNTTKTLLGILLFMCLIIIGANNSIGSDNQQLTNTVYLSPFYNQTLNANTNYTYNLIITPPRGFEKIQHATITFDLYVAPTVNYNVWVNGQSCNPTTYNIGTTFANAGAAKITFDCTNRITSAGTYTVTMRSDKNNNAVIGSSTITYTSNPSAKLSVSGTDYEPGDNAKIFVQLVTGGNPVNKASCRTKVWYPDSSLAFGYATMSFLDDGIYYYDFTAPSVIGVYPIEVDCAYISTQYGSLATSGFVRVGNQGGTYQNTWANDTSYWTGQENSGSGRNIDMYVNFSGTNYSTGGAYSTNQVELITYWRRATSSLIADFINVQVYNFNTSSWVTLTSEDSIPYNYSGSGVGDFVIKKYLLTQNISFYVSSNNTFAFRFNDTIGAPTDTQDQDLVIDILNLNVYNILNNTIVENIKGAGELNIRNRTATIVANLLYNDTNVLNSISSVNNSVVFYGLSVLNDTAFLKGNLSLVLGNQTVIQGLSYNILNDTASIKVLVNGVNNTVTTTYNSLLLALQNVNATLVQNTSALSGQNLLLQSMIVSTNTTLTVDYLSLLNAIVSTNTTSAAGHLLILGNQTVILSNQGLLQNLSYVILNDTLVINNNLLGMNSSITTRLDAITSNILAVNNNTVAYGMSINASVNQALLNTQAIMTWMNQNNETNESINVSAILDAIYGVNTTVVRYGDKTLLNLSSIYNQNIVIAGLVNGVNSTVMTTYGALLNAIESTNSTSAYYGLSLNNSLSIIKNDTQTIINWMNQNNETNESNNITTILDAINSLNSTGNNNYQNLLYAIESANTTTITYAGYILNDTSDILGKTNDILIDTGNILDDTLIIRKNTFFLLNDTAIIKSMLVGMNNTVNLIYDQGTTIIGNTHQILGNITIVLNAIAAEAVNDSGVNDALYQINSTVNNILTTTLQINTTVNNLNLSVNTSINQSDLINEINNTITGQIVAEIQAPRTFTIDVVLLIVFAILIITLVWVRSGGWWLLVGFYGALYGLFLIPLSTFMGFIILGLGGAIVVAGWYKLR